MKSILSPKQRIDALKKKKATKKKVNRGNTARFVAMPDEIKIIKVGKKDSADPTTEAYQEEQTFERAIDDTELSNEILSETFDFLYNSAVINTEYDVPYLAGMSTDGKTVYIDRHFPKYSMQGSRKINNYKYVTGHERIERGLEDSIPGIKYQRAHQLTLQNEHCAVTADDFDWNQYDAFCNQYIKFSWHEQLTNLPPDLDIKPYLDENDQAVLMQIQKAQKEKSKDMLGSPMIVSGD